MASCSMAAVPFTRLVMPTAYSANLRMPLVRCEAVQVRKAPITVHIGETSLTFPLSQPRAEALNTAITGLLTIFKEKEKASKPQRWKNLDYQHIEDDGVTLEVFCNPNAFTNAFQATVLITVNDGKINVTSEAQLSVLKADIEQYMKSI